MLEAPNSYDEVPYPSVALVETHPERAAVVASLFGLEAPPVETARVLELGCAGGENLVPMARILPGATFVGVDLSPRQVEQAGALARACGAENVSFQARSLAEITPDFGRFDYILCHGVYSWVPDEVKAAILRICSENLAPNGVAYVSYNTLPGWHAPGMVREMMLYHVRATTDPEARVKAARAFLDFLAENAADRDGLYARTLAEEAKLLRSHADSYILHEHLEDLNHPVYFHEFAARAAGSGLRVLGDARYWTMATSTQGPVASVLDRVANEPIPREQYLDFLHCRRFRRSLLCHADRSPLAEPSIEGIKRLRASALVWPANAPADFATKARVDFRAVDGAIRLSTIEPLFKAALIVLTECFPRSLPFEELWTAARGRLRGAGVEPGESSEPLARRLLQAYAANAVELHTVEPGFATTPSESPRPFEIARIAAETASVVPNLRHRQINLSDFDRLVLRHLDGRRRREEIVERLVTAVSEGAFTIHQNGGPARDPDVTRPILARSLEPSLLRLARGSLLRA